MFILRGGRVQFYRISGLSVASEIGLPGLIAGAPERSPQVTIRRELQLKEAA
jgi:hypothetical protein